MGKVKLLTAFTHIAGLAIFLSLPVFFITNQAQNSVWTTIFSLSTLQFIGIYIFIFYFHTYILIPQLYRKKRFILYFISMTLLFAAILFLKPFDRLMHSNRENMEGMRDRMRENIGNGFKPGSPPERDSLMPPLQENGRFREHMNDNRRPFNPQEESRARIGRVIRGNPNTRIDIISIYLFAMTLAFSLSIEFRQKLREAEQRALKADADKANAELFFLKAQINPHFLFNTLNNIYSLAAAKSDLTAESILKLSNIMRYVTEEVAENVVPLDDEIAFMTDYIDLQRLRLGKKMKVSLQMPDDPTGKNIAPLILMTFIENAFKYGLSNHTDSEIIIHLITHQYSIEFFCRNRVSDKPQNTNTGTGIGIKNTRARLEHLYPGKHMLDIGQENGQFTVKLILQV